MLHFLIGLFIIFTSIAAETTEKKIVQMDALKAPNVYMSDTRFIFEGIIMLILLLI
jgi:hypothetical protein